MLSTPLTQGEGAEQLSSKPAHSLYQVFVFLTQKLRNPDIVVAVAVRSIARVLLRNPDACIIRWID